MDNMELLRNHDNMEQPQQDQQKLRVKPPAQNCPRCHSANIRFCYYNNYNISQPRYFCKACRRYWTQGGTLRNIPIGSKRSRTSDASSSSGDELTRTTRSFSTAFTPPQNYEDIFPSQFSRAFPSPLVMLPVANSFQDGGITFSSSPMQMLPAAVNLGATVGPRGGGAYFGSNLTILQGFALAHLKPQVPQQCVPQNHHFSTQESMVFSKPTIYWNQSFINNIARNSSGGSPSLWSGYQTSSFFNPNQWPANKHSRFGASQP